MKIAVLGGGNGSYAAAADLTEQGHEVRFWRRDAQAFAPVLNLQAVTLKDDRGTRSVPLAKATTDLKEAIVGADLVVIPTPATAQEDIAVLIAPYLEDGQVVFLPPGTFGSVVMARIVQKAGSTADVTFAETGTLPYLTRKHGHDAVAITVRAIRLPTGFYPARHTVTALAKLQAAFPAVHACEDALSAALLNGGPIIHPPLIMLNASALQHFPSWDIHNEGTQPAVRSVTDELDAERIQVREALGYHSAHFPIADTYSGDKWMYGDTHKVLTDSGEWREKIELTSHRYMLEDVGLGLAFMCSVARYMGVEAPVAHGLLALGGAIVGRDFRLNSRTFEHMEIDILNVTDLQQKLQSGGL